MDRVRAAVEGFWNDADRRRAFLLSVVAHLCVLLLFILWLTRPEPVPLEQYIVLDLGTPAESTEQVEAPTARDPAPASNTPQVADEDTGEPQARTAQQQETAVPEPEQRTEQPLPQPAAQTTAQPQVAEEPEVQQSQTDPEPVQTSGDPPVAPAPQVREPTPQSATAQLPEAPTATVLPEIDQVELEPQRAQQAINIPQPQVSSQVPEARRIAVEAAAQVAPTQQIPAPRANAQVTAALPVPQPTVRSEVAATVPVPRPQVAADVPAPNSVPRPQATANVSPPTAIPIPTSSVEVAAAREVPLPGVQAQVEQATPVDVAAQVTVSRPLEVPTPQVAARVTAPQPETGAAMAGAAPAGLTENPSNRLDDRPPGGNAERTTQDRAEPDAQAGNLGRAAGPDGGEATGAESRRPEIPFREERERPLAVVLDNAAGYPQSGLTSASTIAELPVEGGLTRLLAFFDQSDPGQVGPIRSARDYLVELAQSYDGILVHDGGSPAALAMIDRSGIATLNSFRYGNLFSRAQGRAAPYNLYSSGTTLRDAVNRLSLDQSFELRGVVPRPPQDAPDASGVSVRYGGTYQSGFGYISELDIYRWQRNGENAVDASGEAVFVEAVLLARIDARPIPDDPAGRLYIPLRGGDATLYLRGKAVAGRWQLAADDQGVLFEREDGESVDLSPFRTWILFAPGYAEVSN